MPPCHISLPLVRVPAALTLTLIISCWFSLVHERAETQDSDAPSLLADPPLRLQSSAATRHHLASAAANMPSPLTLPQLPQLLYPCSHSYCQTRRPLLTRTLTSILTISLSLAGAPPARQTQAEARPGQGVYMRRARVRVRSRVRDRYRSPGGANMASTGSERQCKISGME